VPLITMEPNEEKVLLKEALINNLNIVVQGMHQLGM